mgnify:CR=1 FL=1
MSLRVKFNVILLLSFVVGYAATSYIAYAMLQKNAKDEVLHHAKVMMASAMAIRAYTIEKIKPLLVRQQMRTFIKQTVPAYAATWNFHKIKEVFSEYSYKEATLNPTNLKNRATDFEVGIISFFKANPEIKSKTGERVTPDGRSLYLSKPMRVGSEACLSCHGKPADAPETMKAIYGDKNGFGWKLNEIIGTRIISVPMKVPYQRAYTAFKTFSYSIGAVFLVVLILLNVFLNNIIIVRVKNISAVAHDISLGKKPKKEINTNGHDEISELAKSFNRMRVSLNSAMDMLKGKSNKK